MIRLSLFALLASAGIHAGSVPYKSPLHGDDHPNRRDGYLVAFATNYTIDEHWQRIGENLTCLDGFIHYHMLFGYHAKMNGTTLELVRSDPNVTMVERDRFETTDLETPDSNATLFKDEFPTPGTRQHSKRARHWNTIIDPYATYNLQMVGAGSMLTDIEQFHGEYEVLEDAGQGVNIYIVDSGIRITHEQFGGRASNFGGLDSTAPTPYLTDGETMQDQIGHGTAVAGLAGSTGLGVAIDANLVNVKVLDKTGKFVYSLAIKAINDIYAEHNNNKDNVSGFRGSVVNLSFGNRGSAFWLGQAIGWGRSYAQGRSLDLPDGESKTYADDFTCLGVGVNFVGAAGNSRQNAGRFWPCQWTSVMCVAAVGKNYRTWKSNNYGSAVDYLAPGMGVLTLSYLGDDTVQKWTGTSFAAPHVAGLAAIFTSWKALTNGGASGYVLPNSLDNVCSGRITNNKFATSGIRDTRKYPNEPFRWAGDDPVDAPLDAGPAPVSLGSGAPPGATQSTDIMTLTDAGTSYTMSSPTGWQTMSSATIGDIGFNSVIVTDTGGSISGVTVTPLPVSILADLGLSTLGGPPASSSVLGSTPIASSITGSGMSTTTGGLVPSGSFSPTVTFPTQPHEVVQPSPTQNPFPDPPYALPGSTFCGAYGEYTTGSGIDLSYAESLITNFCSINAAVTSQYSLIAQPWDFDASPSVFYIALEWSQETCTAEENVVVGGTKHSSAVCYDRLLSVMNDCDTSTTTEKLGGSSAIGCVVWTAIIGAGKKIGKRDTNINPTQLKSIYAL